MLSLNTFQAARQSLLGALLGLGSSVTSCVQGGGSVDPLALPVVQGTKVVFSSMELLIALSTSLFDLLKTPTYQSKWGNHRSDQLICRAMVARTKESELTFFSSWRFSCEVNKFT